MLSRFETLLNNEIRHSHFSEKEREVIKDMKDALKVKDEERINRYLKLNMRANDISIHQIIRNAISFNRGLVFGFKDIVFNEYGWLNNQKWIDRSCIEFKFSKALVIWNKIEIAKGQNNKWSYGLYYSTSSGNGGALGLSVFDPPYDSYEEALEKALDDLCNRHKNSDTDISKFIRKSIEKQRKELKKIDKNNQFLLF